MRIHVLIILGLMLMGCRQDLETGYRPARLGVTTEERRAYYAPQFSPAAAMGQGAKENITHIRRPTGY